MSFKKIISYTLLAVFAGSTFISFIPQTAYAAVTYTRVDIRTIRSYGTSDGQHYFVNSDPTNSTKFTDYNDTDGCPDYITLEVDIGDTSKIVTQTLSVTKPQSGNNGSCTVPATSNISVSNNYAGQQVVYYWVNKNQIGRYEVTKTDGNNKNSASTLERVSIPALTYTRSSQQNANGNVVFIEDTGTDCKATLTFSENLSNATFTGAAGKKDDKLRFGLYIGTNFAGQVAGTYLDNRYVKASNEVGAGCFTGNTEGGKPANVPISLVENASLGEGEAGVTPAAVTAKATGTNDTDTCDSTGITLSWLFCGLIDGLAKAVDGIYANLIQPLLKTTPIDINNSKSDKLHTFEVWANFRVYANIFLIIALLVIVFGQSIGGGLIDAYSAKKILPRLLIAAVLINLSIYIVAFAVDITNIIGQGLGQLIQQPFNSAINAADNGAKLQINGTTSGIGLAALVGGGIWAALSFGPMLQFLLVFFLVPALLAFIAILVTLLLRNGLIIFLVFVSPVAFALYCLPNTEQYFRKWWDLLFKTLLIYPIIAVIFAIANILAATINISSQTSGIKDTLGDLLSIIALVAPLFLIPYSFRIAGGLLGRAHEVASGIGKRGAEAYKGNPNDPTSRQNRARRNLADRNVRTRERGVNWASKQQKNSNSMLYRKGVGLFGAALNSGDLELKRSMLNKQEAENRELKTNFGPDSSVRALFAEKGEDGKWRSVINGSQFSDLEVQKARSLYGGNKSAIQAALNYELGKTANDTEYNSWLEKAPKILEDFGYDQDTISGDIMKGIGYQNASKRLDLKHSSFQKNAQTGKWERTIDYAKMTQDAAENFGSYPLSSMKTSAIMALSKAHDEALAASTDPGYRFGEEGRLGSRAEAADILRDTQQVANILDTRMAANGGTTGAEVEEGMFIGGAGQPQRSAGAGRVDHEITQFVEKVRGPMPTRGSTGGTGGSGGSGGTPPPAGSGPSPTPTPPNPMGGTP